MMTIFDQLTQAERASVVSQVDVAAANSADPVAATRLKVAADHLRARLHRSGLTFDELDEAAQLLAEVFPGSKAVPPVGYQVHGYPKTE